VSFRSTDTVRVLLLRNDVVRRFVVVTLATTVDISRLVVAAVDPFSVENTDNVFVLMVLPVSVLYARLIVLSELMVHVD